MTFCSQTKARRQNSCKFLTTRGINKISTAQKCINSSHWLPKTCSLIKWFAGSSHFILVFDLFLLKISSHNSELHVSSTIWRRCGLLKRPSESWKLQCTLELRHPLLQFLQKSCAMSAYLSLQMMRTSSIHEQSAQIPKWRPEIWFIGWK